MDKGHPHEVLRGVQDEGGTRLNRSWNHSLEQDLASAHVLHPLHFLVPIFQRQPELGWADHGHRSKGYEDLGGGHEVP